MPFFEKLSVLNSIIEESSLQKITHKLVPSLKQKQDVYPRFAPTMEWDTAAGHAIAKHAGKKLIDLQTKQEMIYNRPRLTNNWFIVE